MRAPITQARVAGLLNLLRGLAEDADLDLEDRHVAQVAETQRKHPSRPSLPGRLEALATGKQATRRLVERGHALAQEGILLMLTASGAYPGPTREGGER